MYFGSSNINGSIGWMFERSTLVFLAVMFGLAVWKLAEIVYWLWSNVSITWG